MTSVCRNNPRRSAALLISVGGEKRRRHCSDFRNHSYSINDDYYCSLALIHHAQRLEHKKRNVTMMHE